MNDSSAGGGRRAASVLSWCENHPRLSIALCSLLWGFCYPPFPFGLLAFVVLVPAFAVTSKLRPRQAFSAYFVGGLLYNIVMYWWIYNVIKVGPALAIGGGLILLILFLSLFNGLIGLGFRLALRHRLLLATFPFAWAGLEAARAWGEMSFPWNDFGYTLGHSLPLIQSVAWVGIYGLSLLLVAANLCGLQAWRSQGTRRALWLTAWVAIPLALALQGIATLRQPHPDSPSLDISLVQPAIPQTKKWNETYFSEVMAKTFRTLDGPKGDLAPVLGSDLVVFAETAVPDFLRSRPEIIDSLSRRALLLHAPILVGALDFVRQRKPWSEYRFYNAAFLFRPETGSKVEQYNKMRLVPFSEKLPFEKIFPILNYVHLGEGDFSPGDGYRIWGGRIRYAPSICYEVIYPDFVRQAKRAGAQFLVNITNDSWFGRSNGPYQHANIARFRAVEAGLPIARCANSGVSVFYDAWGRDLGHTRLMDSTVLRRRLPVPHRDTFYQAHGGALDHFYLAALALWMAAAAGLNLRRASAGTRGRA